MRDPVIPVLLAAAFALSGCGTDTANSQTAAVTVVSAPAAGPAAALPPAPTPDPVVTPVQSVDPAPAATPVLLSALKPLDLSKIHMGQANTPWYAATWASNQSQIPWRADRISQPNGTDTYFTLTNDGAPALQARTGAPEYTNGLWEIDATMPQLQDGLVVAPLWLFDMASFDEIDFEFAGRKGLDVTMHTAGADGVMKENFVRLFAGRDMSGERHRFGIRVDQNAGTVEMYFDGVMVHRWDRQTTTPFVSHPFKPIISMWAADPNKPAYVGWVGAWTGLASGQQLTMTVHGYGYTALK